MTKDQIKAIHAEMQSEFNKYGDKHEMAEEDIKDYNEFKKIFFDFFNEEVLPDIKKLNRVGDSTRAFVFKHEKFKDKSAYLIVYFLHKILEECFQNTGISFSFNSGTYEEKTTINFNWRA